MAKTVPYFAKFFSLCIFRTFLYIILFFVMAATYMILVMVMNPLAALGSCVIYFVACYPGHDITVRNINIGGRVCNAYDIFPYSSL